MNKLEGMNNSRSRRKCEYLEKLKEENFSMNDSYSFLYAEGENEIAFDKDFKIIFQTPSLREQEKADEFEMYETISILNQQLKNKNYDNCSLVKLLRSEISIDEKNSNKFLSINSNGETDYNSNSTIDTVRVENIITQNLSAVEDLVKVLVIGDKDAGKTTFIKNLINFDKSGEEFFYGEIPTTTS
jgi:hypothetical protein